MTINDYSPGMRSGTMQEWTTDALWAKAQAYCEQTFEVDPQSALFPLLASFTLELLGKAALAKVHPVLVADPRGDNGLNILYAFGVPTKSPQTIVAKTVFSRLRALVPEFTEEDEGACLLLADRRNRDLHAGEFAYKDYRSGQWLPDFYRVVSVLCEYLGRDLGDLLGAERGADAIEAAADERGKVKATVARKLAAAKAAIAALRPEELVARRKAHQAPHGWSHHQGRPSKATKCPACESRASLSLRHIADRPAQVDGDQIYTEAIYSPRAFACGTCDLELIGTGELREVDLADQVQRYDETSATEYFEFDPGYEEYGND